MERLVQPSLRFLCRPQLVIIDIRPKATHAEPPSEESVPTAAFLASP